MMEGTKTVQKTRMAKKQVRHEIATTNSVTFNKTNNLKKSNASKGISIPSFCSFDAGSAICLPVLPNNIFKMNI